MSAVALKCGKHVLTWASIMPETTVCHLSSVGCYHRSYVATLLAFFASCDSTLRTFFLVIGLVMGNPAQACALQSQMVKSRNGLRLWSDMWK